ncbi:hypothetical protein A0H81_06991 [Grifola frondosa]|uniref:Uncharacterized protein n=1 Tax=Grifola frondosa TaxID=5627 RepID=A0A1C7M860_GRIFR|nr:hypothetical protein A0H81_06991 [Grifola frondosa]
MQVSADHAINVVAFLDPARQHCKPCCVSSKYDLMALHTSDMSSMGHTYAHTHVPPGMENPYHHACTAPHQTIDGFSWSPRSHGIAGPRGLAAAHQLGLALAAAPMQVPLGHAAQEAYARSVSTPTCSAFLLLWQIRVRSPYT